MGKIILVLGGVAWLFFCVATLAVAHDIEHGRLTEQTWAEFAFWLKFFACAFVLPVLVVIGRVGDLGPPSRLKKEIQALKEEIQTLKVEIRQLK